MRRVSTKRWVAWSGLCLALLLSSCLSREATAPPSESTLAPPPRARPVAPSPALRVGLWPGYPPIVFKEQGELTGLEVDFARGLGEELGRHIVLVERAWTELIPALETGQIDVIMSGMSITEARGRRVRFVQSYIRLGQMAIIRKADRLNLGAPSLLTRTHGRVGFIAGSTGEDYVREQIPHAHYVPLASPDDGVQAVRDSVIDVFIHDQFTALRMGSHEASDTLTSFYSPLTEESLAWAVRLNDEDLQRDLEAVLERWKHSGRLQTLFHKWLSFRLE